MTTLATVAAGTGAIPDINSNFIATSPAGMYARKDSTTSGLTWGYYGGRGFGNTISDGTVSLTASTTNYVVANRSTGAVTVATSTTNWNDTTNYFRLYEISTGGSSVSSYTDFREMMGGGAAGMANPMTTAGDIIYGGTSGVPTRLAIGTNGYVLSVSSGIPAWVSGLTNPMSAVGDLIIGGASGAATRLAGGTNGYVLTMVSGAPAWVAAGSSSLTNWTEAVNTSAPNATVPVVSFTATNAATNVDAALRSKGTGAILAQIPDSSTAGGNKRGTNAVDWQMSRTAAAAVASGAYSGVLSGRDGTASAQTSVVLGGDINASTGRSSISGGEGTTAGGICAVSLGKNTAASSDYSTARGRSTMANAEASEASGFNSTVRGVYGAQSWASGTFSSQGDAQGRRFILRAATANATPTAVSADGNAIAATNQLSVPANSAIAFDVVVVARQASNGDCARWTVKGLAKSVSTTVSLVGTPSVALDFNDSGASSWALAVTADNTNKAVTFTVTGVAATNLKWVVAPVSVEVAG